MFQFRHIHIAPVSDGYHDSHEEPAPVRRKVTM